MIEMQAMIVQFIEAFKFSLPDEEYTIKRAPTGIMSPLIENKETLGVQMPLRVEAVGES